MQVRSLPAQPFVCSTTKGTVKAEARPRGRDVRKMNKPYIGREVVYSCSNGWTIERVIEEEFPMEAFFMGHCLSPTSCGVDAAEVYSLREPDGTPHATVVRHEAQWEFVGRCNQPPKDKYMALITECETFNEAL